MPHSKPDSASATSPLPTSVDPKPLAAAKLGFCSRYLGLDIIEDALSELTDDVHANVFAGLTEAVRQANDDYVAYEHTRQQAFLLPPKRALPEWSGPPTWICARIRRYAEGAIELGNRYRRWLDVGVSLGDAMDTSNSVATSKAVQNAIAQLSDDEVRQVGALDALSMQLKKGDRLEDAMVGVLRGIKPGTQTQNLLDVKFFSSPIATGQFDLDSEACLIVVKFFNAVAADLARFERIVETGWDQESEQRNKWLYEQCNANVPYQTIIIELKAKASRKQWNPIESVPGIKRAAEAYAKRMGLPLPPTRTPGRPAGTKSKRRRR